MQGEACERGQVDDAEPGLGVGDVLAGQAGDAAAEPSVRGEPGPRHDAGRQAATADHQRARLAGRGEELGDVIGRMLPVAVEEDGPRVAAGDGLAPAGAEGRALAEGAFVLEDPGACVAGLGARGVERSVVHDPRRRHVPQRAADDGSNAPGLVAGGNDGAALGGLQRHARGFPCGHDEVHGFRGGS